MEKIVNINKAPKDDVLNKIMQEIDDENLSAETTIPPKKKKSKKNPKVKKAPAKKSWTRWIVNFIFLVMTSVFIFVLVLIFKATEEIKSQEVVSVTKVEDNNAPNEEKNLSKVIAPSKVKAKVKDEKVPDNLIIFDMKYKKSTAPIEQAPYVPLKHVKKAETVQKPLTEREKAKALLKEQMSF